MTAGARPTRSRAAGLLLWCACLALGGCAGPDPRPAAAPLDTAVAAADGPLAQSTSAGRACIPVGPDGTAGFGFDVLANPTASAATITSVRLSDAHGVAVVGAYLVPVRDELLGTTSSFPPGPDQLVPGARWGARQQLPGGSVPAAGRSGTQNLLVGLRLTGTGPGASGPVELGYRLAGHDYTWRSALSLQLVRPPQICPT